MKSVKIIVKKAIFIRFSTFFLKFLRFSSENFFRWLETFFFVANELVEDAAQPGRGYRTVGQLAPFSKITVPEFSENFGKLSLLKN